MTQLDPSIKLLPVDDPGQRARHAGRPCVICATGPSADLVDLASLGGAVVIAVNAAITEFVHHPLAYWHVHDTPKLLSRDRFCDRVHKLRRWRMVTRRVYLPGKVGAVPWRDVEERRIPDPFPTKISPPPGSTVWWYSDWPEQGAWIRNGHTAVAGALDVAALWGMEPIVLVGVDLAPVGGAAYARPWAWKTCHIRRGKWAVMRADLAANRARWPARVLTVSPHWPDAPFERIPPREIGSVLSPA